MEIPMHEPHTDARPAVHVPFKQEGWGIALAVVLLAVATAATAAYVHKTTYRPPTDVRFHATGSAASHR
jgi:hypothetical protein